MTDSTVSETLDSDVEVDVELADIVVDGDAAGVAIMPSFDEK